MALTVPNGEASFKTDLERGRGGEEVVASWLRSLSSVLEVEDKRLDAFYQATDVDFVAVLKKKPTEQFSRRSKWEVKSDAYPLINGTISYEIVSNFQRGTIGCALKTQSDFLAFFLPQTGQIAYWDTNKLRSWAARESTRFELAKVLNYHPGSSEPQVGLCLKLPFEEALKEAGGKLVNPGVEPEEEEVLVRVDYSAEQEIDY